MNKCFAMALILVFILAGCGAEIQDGNEVPDSSDSLADNSLSFSVSSDMPELESSSKLTEDDNGTSNGGNFSLSVSPPMTSLKWDSEKSPQLSCLYRRGKKTNSHTCTAAAEPIYYV